MGLEPITVEKEYIKNGTFIFPFFISKGSLFRIKNFFKLFLSPNSDMMAKIIINSQSAPAPIGPYSQAVKAGNTLYISGQIALIPETGAMDNKTIQEETHRVMKNLGEILKAAGLNYSNVVKSTIFVKDLNNFVAVNQVYGEYFTSEPPARETVEVSRLPKDANVEISCIAVAE